MKDYIEKIASNNKIEDMKKLADMLVDSLEDLKQYDSKMYNCYKTELYEMAYGEVVSKEEADEWVNSMKPFGKKWSIEDTTEVMKSNGYDFRDIDFYVVCNMMYNDNYNDVKEDEPLAIKLAYNWLNDADAVKNKLYRYKKYIVNDRTS